MSVLFIADLHLQDQRPELTRALLRFLEHHSSSADSLYILGDLFEVWVGDDHETETINSVADGLKKLTDKGVPVFIQHGNRDFLIGQSFMERCGSSMLPESQTIQPYDTPLLLMHGDQLCLDDTDYQAFRKLVRSAEWQSQFLSQTLPERLTIADDLRLKSQELARQKDMEIMDVSPSEVDRVMTNSEVNVLIHGHTHRPNIHHLREGKTRIVLGDWGPQLWFLEWKNDDTYKLHHQPIS
ncbi:UDP-2,3-diacylglucosamine diphosphatase [Motiliproteus sp. MSK22-1]|uniref:UDP-2,3-diacylglucosamine diphosphatase n=1 Tax=Motiliproteus sp. MSK22-1 TaxID=1897630 RepID=UPI000978053A|nr:UDP-2,3-diacylglucosamine diphosphatase [Motiliproteus sp. MSK22-1]OMH29514.1 UDP-2,3-diacylglucosamine diphosphatase [Motiliproteus sp. MSK22-1]